MALRNVGKTPSTRTPFEAGDGEHRVGCVAPHGIEKDLGPLRTALLDAKYGVGDFEFARHGVGTGIEAFLVLGAGLYLICNNTRESMDGIAKNPRWLNAQVPFVELAEAVRANPLGISWDTKIFTKP